MSLHIQKSEAGTKAHQLKYKEMANAIAKQDASVWSMNTSHISGFPCNVICVVY